MTDPPQVEHSAPFSVPQMTAVGAEASIADRPTTRREGLLPPRAASHSGKDAAYAAPLALWSHGTSIASALSVEDYVNDALYLVELDRV
jgi:hypothetical protein